jgi:CPA2 family monovalent cation:H+ antiporter-2
MEQTFLFDLTVLFGAAVLVSYLFRAIRLSTIVGFLVAGALIGPGGLQLIESTEEVRQMEEIGIMLLLFSIGVEFSIDKLRRNSWVVLVGGSAQVLATGLIVGVFATLISGSTRMGIFIGMLAALSSTVIGLRILHDKGLTMAPQGNVALSILIFQDIAVLPMMLFLPFITGSVAADLGSVVGTLSISIIAIVLILATARVLVPRLIERTVRARSRDIFILSVIVTLVGIAWVSSRFGISAGLGAFIAGLVISESEYSHQVLSDVLPFRETFNSLFFVSIGMLLDPLFVWENALVITGAALAIVVTKSLIGAGVVRLLGYPLRIAIVVGLLLSQVGEFSIVLLRAADGFLTIPVQQAVLATILITMVLSTLAERASDWLPSGESDTSAPDAGIEPPSISGHTVIVGYGLNGRNVAAMLRASELPYVVLEMNPRTVSRASNEGVPIFYGDAISDTILERMGAARARTVVFAISDPVATRQGVAAARRLNRQAYVIARTRYESEIEPLYQAGADTVVTEEFETSLTIIRRIMDRLGVHPTRIDHAILDIRQRHYEPLLKSEVRGIEPSEAIRMFEGTVRAVADGQSIGALRVRQESGATIVAVEREGELNTNPGPGYVLREGDRVHLIGSEQEVGRALTLM